MKSSGNTELITFFRKGMLKKFIVSSTDGKRELSFLEAAEQFNTDEKERKVSISKDYYDLLKINKEHFDYLTTEELVEKTSKRGRSNESTVVAKLKAFKKVKSQRKKELK